jgi:hypothetical protein
MNNVSKRVIGDSSLSDISNIFIDYFAAQLEIQSVETYKTANLQLAVLKLRPSQAERNSKINRNK